MPSSPMQQRLERNQPATEFAHDAASRVAELADDAADLTDEVTRSALTLARAHARHLDRTDSRHDARRTP